MKIKNELVSIKIGRKQYDFKNLILDEYLKRFAKAQIQYTNTYNNLNSTKETAVEYEDRTNLLLSCCFLKFEESLDKEKNDLKNTDFDLVTSIPSKVNQDISARGVSIQYTYNLKEFSDCKNLKYANINDYNGKKITAIGFNSLSKNKEKYSICAILDTSNYNIYLQEKQIFTITRKDVIQTDALFNSNSDKYKGPFHLAPFKEIYNVYQENNEDDEDFNRNSLKTRKSFLYSIGLSSYSDYIDKEFVVGKDVQIENNGKELIIKGLENYCSNNCPSFPTNEIYPSADIYPLKSNYKYIIFKYKIYEYPTNIEFYYDWIPYTDTGYFYCQAIPIDKFGKSNIKIKYERG